MKSVKISLQNGVYLPASFCKIRVFGYVLAKMKYLTLYTVSSTTEVNDIF